MSALVWLANHCASQGTPLRGGQIVSLGSLVKTHWLTPGTHINNIGSHSPNARELDTATVQCSKFVADLKDHVAEYGAKGLAYFKVKDGRLDSTIAKFFNDDQQQRIIAKLDGEDGDLLLFVADKPEVTSAALAALRSRISMGSISSPSAISSITDSTP